jgi:hypothetical protein
LFGFPISPEVQYKVLQKHDHRIPRCW